MAKPRKNANGERPYGWRIVKVKMFGGREWQLHATKGWRRRRA